MSTWLTCEQVGTEIGMSADYVARQCKAGHLRAKKLGTEWRIHPDAIREFMDETAPAPAARERLSARQLRRRSA